MTEFSHESAGVFAHTGEEVMSIDDCYPMGPRLVAVDGTDIFLNRAMDFDRVKYYVAVSQSDFGYSFAVFAKNSTENLLYFLSR